MTVTHSTRCRGTHHHCGWIENVHDSCQIQMSSNTCTNTLACTHTQSATCFFFCFKVWHAIKFSSIFCGCKLQTRTKCLFCINSLSLHHLRCHSSSLIFTMLYTVINQSHIQSLNSHSLMCLSRWQKEGNDEPACNFSSYL